MKDASAVLVSHCLEALGDWEHADGARPFPYQAVMACFRNTGKHFVPQPVLHALASARAQLPAQRGDARTSRRFLDVALDKFDEAYDYHSYIGISLLDLTPEADGPTAQRERGEWLGLLLADLWAFEEAGRDETTAWLPLLRPGPELYERRMRLLGGLLSRTVTGYGDKPAEITERLLDAAPSDRLLSLFLGMQPVYLMHDEYMFVRVLQSFEVTFASMAGHMRDAVVAVTEGRVGVAVSSVGRCAVELSGARPLFSLLATMRPESFSTFRAFTVGASAIQSSNYKIFEALCSQPAAHRIDSPAFCNVPEVQKRVRDGWRDFTSAVWKAASSGVVDEHGLASLHVVARDLEDVHQRWKQTHWRLAVHMIGGETGTGYTAGVPYLREAIDNRLFADLLSTRAGGRRD